MQYAVAAVCTTIVSGCVVARMTILGYFLWAFFHVCWTYPVVAHWVWAQGGWLNKLGFIDFAGTSVVHLVGGSAGLILTVIMRPRKGRFDEDK